jgi:hypothetical protein
VWHLEMRGGCCGIRTPNAGSVGHETTGDPAMINAARRCGPWLVLAAWTLLLPTLHAQSSKKLEGLRTWTDSTGKQKVEAEFVELKNGNVTLKTSQGRTLTLPLDRFSKPDQELIRATQPAVGPDGQSIANTSGVRTIVLKAPQKFKLEAEELPVADKPFVDAVPLSTKIGDGFAESVVPLGFERAAGQAIVLRAKGDDCMIERCDLTSGKSLGAFELPKNTRPLDVDPTGQRLVTRSQYFGFGRNGQLDVWDLGGFEPTRVASWEPYAAAKASGKDVVWAALIDADHVLTYGSGAVTLWNIPQTRAIYSVTINRMPVVSAGRRYLAVAALEGMFVLDAKTGQPLGQLSGDTTVQLVFSFRQDAQRLAVYSGDRLRIWDCQTGDLYREIFLQSVPPTQMVEWLDDDHVMVGFGYVIDIERRMALWRYEGISSNGQTYGGKFWFATGGGPYGTLAGFKLPHDEALKSLAAIPPDQLLALRPGSSVRLDVRLGFSAELQPKIVAGLTERLKENGIRVAPDARLRFEATAENAGQKPVEYKEFGIGGRSTTVQVSKNIYYLRIKEGDTVLWQAGGPTDPPPLVMLEKGESVQSALNRFNALNQDFFLKTPLPKQLARIGKHNGFFGVSRLSGSGIETTAHP